MAPVQCRGADWFRRRTPRPRRTTDTPLGFGAHWHMRSPPPDRPPRRRAKASARGNRRYGRSSRSRPAVRARTMSRARLPPADKSRQRLRRRWSVRDESWVSTEFIFGLPTPDDKLVELNKRLIAVESRPPCQNWVLHRIPGNAAATLPDKL